MTPHIDIDVINHYDLWLVRSFQVILLNVVLHPGYGFGYDDVVISGDVSAGKFCAYYTIGDDVVAVATMMSDPVAAEVAQKMLAGDPIKKSALK